MTLAAETADLYSCGAHRPWPFDRGWRQNFAEVFGRQRRLWFLPLHSHAARRALLEGQLGKSMLPPSFLSC